jgi:hypothetical protein
MVALMAHSMVDRLAQRMELQKVDTTAAKWGHQKAVLWADLKERLSGGPSAAASVHQWVCLWVG